MTLETLSYDPLAYLVVPRVFEHAHFIMERGMMRGVRARAERMVAQPARVSER
jgi:hypothetical protein